MAKIPTLRPLTTTAFSYPEARQPDDYDREYLLDVAAAGSQSASELADSPEHVRAICGLVSELDITSRNAFDQLTIVRGIGAKTMADLIKTRGLLSEERDEVRRLRGLLAVRDTELNVSQRLGLAFQQLIFTVTGKTAEELQRQLDHEAELLGGGR